jgi:hypothetical protein
MKRLSVLVAALLLLAHPVDSATRVNDHVLALLPADLFSYVGVEDFRQLEPAAKEFLERVAPNSKLFEDLQQKMNQGIGQLPEPFKTSIQEGMKKVISIHVAATSTFAPIAIVRADDEAFMTKLVHETIKSKSIETIVLGDRKAYRIEDAGIPYGAMFVTSVKDIGIACSDLEPLKDILARADGKTAPAGLKGTPLFEKLSTARKTKLGVQSYVDIGRLFTVGISYSSNSRYGAYQSMQVDAVTGIGDLRNAWFEMSYEQGKIYSKAEVSVGKRCHLYHNIWRQKDGSKDLLKYVPADAAAVAHVNIESGETFLKQLESIVRRADEISSVESGQRRSEWDEFTKEFAQELGITVQEAAEVIDNEAAFFFAPADWDAMMRNANGLCFIGKMKNPDKLKVAVQKVAGGRTFRRMKWQEKPYKGVTIFVGENPDFEPAYALDGTMLLFGSGEKTIQKAIDAKQGANFAPRVTSPCSKVMAINLKALIRFIHVVSQGEVPDWFKQMSDGHFDTAICTESEDRISASAQDCGAAGLGFSGISFMIFPMVMRPVAPIQPPKPETKPIEQVELPKDADKFIAGLIDDLSSDEHAKRDAATQKLKGIGRPAVPALVKALSENTDPEVKSRAEEVLLFLKAYDAFPGLLDRKVGGIVEELKKTFETEQGRWISHWQANQDGLWNIEPSMYMPMFAAPVDMEVLESPEGLRKFASLLTSQNLQPITRQNMAFMLAQRDTASCSAELQKAFETAEQEIKWFSLIALGRCTDAKAREIVIKNLESEQLGLRRSAFLAAERSTDAALIPALLKALDHKSVETKFNAAFTLDQLTKGAIKVNVFLSAAERDAQVKAANEWWDKNKATFKPTPRP